MISRAKTLLNERSGGRRVESSRYTHNRIFNATLNTMKSKWFVEWPSDLFKSEVKVF